MATRVVEVELPIKSAISWVSLTYVMHVCRWRKIFAVCPTGEAQSIFRVHPVQVIATRKSAIFARICLTKSQLSRCSIDYPCPQNRLLIEPRTRKENAFADRVFGCVGELKILGT